jgi:hypothetical protein
VRRLLLAVTATGEKWVERLDGEYVPKVLHRHGVSYTVLMVMSTAHIRRADAWWASVPNGTAKVSLAPNVTR